MKHSHPLLRTLGSLKGNQKACVYTEPLWAVPYNLILPFASLYMSALGLRDSQIGLTASLGLILQLVWGLFSGAITDKYGRRRMMLVFGLISWTVPCFLWASAQSYSYFLMAVFFNSMWRITGNCFSCMINEEGEFTQLVNIYAILNFIGIISGFLSPAAGLLIGSYTLVPVMRGMYLLAMAMMTIKFVLQYRMAYESDIGRQSKEKCRGRSVFTITFSGRKAFLASLRQPHLVLCILFVALLNCFNTVQDTFWSLFVSNIYHVSDSMLSVFPFVKSITMLLAYTVIVPHIDINRIKNPLLTGIALHMAGLLVLLVFSVSASNMMWAVYISAICQALAFAVLGPLCESVMSVSIPSLDRAGINSFIYAVILLISTPAGAIAGILSQHDRALPLFMNLCLITAAAVVSIPMIRIFNKNALKQAAE